MREGRVTMAGADVGRPGDGNAVMPQAPWYPRSLGQAGLPVGIRPCPPAAQGPPAGLVPQRGCPAPVPGSALAGIVAHREAHAMGRSCPRSLGQYGSNVNDPTLNCMRTEDGGAVCSDGVQYPPGCPRTPPEQFFSPGVAPWVDAGGYLIGKVPPPRSADGMAPPVPGAPPDAAPSGAPALLPILAAGAALMYFLGGR